MHTYIHTHTHTYIHTYIAHFPQGMQMTLTAEPTQKLGAFERTYSMREHTLSVRERLKFGASMREHVLARVCFDILCA